MPYKISRSERQVQEEISKQRPLSEFEEQNTRLESTNVADAHSSIFSVHTYPSAELLAIPSHFAVVTSRTCTLSWSYPIYVLFASLASLLFPARSVICNYL